MFDWIIKRMIIWLLRWVDPAKPYGAPLFNAFARLTVSVAVEAVCLRKKLGTGEFEVYLTKRSLDETAYPGQWHIPGTVMRPMEDLEDAFARLGAKEFG